MIISNGWKPLPALQNAIDNQPILKHHIAAGFSAGQNLPTGQSSPTLPTPTLPSSPSSLFAGPALTWLTSQQGQSDITAG